MRPHLLRRRNITVICMALLAAGLFPACQESSTSLESAEASRARAYGAVAAASRPDYITVRAAPMTQPASRPGDRAHEAVAPRELSESDFRVYLPGSVEQTTMMVQDRISKASTRPASTARQAEMRTWDSLLGQLRSAQRPQRQELTLAECIRRAVDHSLTIKIEGYYPAIAVTDIVEAEAQFDAVYYLQGQYVRTDTPQVSQLLGSQNDRRTFETGFQKVLAPGTQVRTAYSVTRTLTDLQYATLNPSYDNDLIFEMRQPLLRNFGLDFNRTRINLAKLDRDTRQERFRRQTRDLLLNVEKTYWDLMQARHDLVIQAQVLFYTADILVRFELRGGYDALPVQVERTRSNLALQAAGFVRLRDRVKEVEDTLKNLLNDPELNLANDVELVPVDSPLLSAVMADSTTAQQSALMLRSELSEALLGVRTARLQIGAARNQALPALDLSFSITENGLGKSWDRAFDELTKNDFLDYALQLRLEIPLGNRAANARLRKAALQYQQAIAVVKKAKDDILTDVNKSFRDMGTAYEQIGPAAAAVEAGVKNLDALLARAVTYSPEFLDVWLNSITALAQARRTFLQAVAAYNVSIPNLERAKGTLLKYNNIHIAEEAYAPHERAR